MIENEHKANSITPISISALRIIESIEGRLLNLMVEIISHYKNDGAVGEKAGASGQQKQAGN